MNELKKEKWRIVLEVEIDPISSVVAFETQRLYSTPTFKVSEKSRKLVK